MFENNIEIFHLDIFIVDVISKIKRSPQIWEASTWSRPRNRERQHLSALAERPSDCLLPLLLPCPWRELISPVDDGDDLRMVDQG